MTKECIGQENKLRIDGVENQLKSILHSLADLSRNLFEQNKIIQDVNKSITTVQNTLTGTELQKGALHKIADLYDEFKDHIKESKHYRPMIEDSYKVTQNLKDSFGIVWKSFLSRLGAGIISSIVTIIGVAWVLVNLTK